MIKNILFLISIIFCSCLHLFGQDPHFSQNVGTPLYVNPAMVGLYTGDIRLGVSYRNQWASVSAAPYQTLLVSVDGKLSSSNRSKGWVSGGIQMLSDQAGLLGLSNNSLEIALSTTTNLGNEHFLSIGALGGLNRRDLNYSNAQFGNQFDGFGYAAEINSGEVFNETGISRFSLSGGVVYYYLKDNRNYWYGGVAAYNLVRSKLAFIGGGDTGLNIPVRLSAQAGGSITLQNRFDFLPSVYFMQQGGHWKTDIGSMFRLIFENNRRRQVFKAISIGPLLRFTNTTTNTIGADAFIFATRLDYDEWAFGLSYDFNLSGLNNATNGKGGTELNLIYTPQIRSRKIGQTSCPRF